MEDLEPWLRWFGGPAGVGVLAWLSRRRLARVGSWVGNRLTVERDLIACRAELGNLAASFARERAGMAAELASRDRTEAYLTQALTALSVQAERVESAHRTGRLVTSGSLPNAPLPSPANSPISPPRPRPANRWRSSRPVAPRNGRKGNGHETR